jgi:hypothetical protein
MEVETNNADYAILNDIRQFTCLVFLLHFEERGLFALNPKQGTAAWLAMRRFASASNFRKQWVQGRKRRFLLVQAYREFVRTGGHPVLSDYVPRGDVRRITNQNLFRGKVGERLVTYFIEQRLRALFPPSNVHILECTSMLIEGMPLASDSPDGAAVICNCHNDTNAPCMAAALEFKFPRAELAIDCPHTNKRCARIVPHACGASCPVVDASLTPLYIPTKTCPQHPCQRCVFEALDCNCGSYERGYYTQCLMHQMALGVGVTIFCQPAGALPVLDFLGVADEDLAGFEPAIDRCIEERRAIPENLFRVYIVQTPDHFVRQQYKETFEKPEFGFKAPSIADAFIKQCQNEQN